jgi:hypothetical protein
LDKKTPEALLKFGIGKGFKTVEHRREPQGDSGIPLFLSSLPYPIWKQCLMVSLTGAITSKKVTEAR